MFKITAAAAALAAIASTSAFAASTAGVINPGLYAVTTEYTAIVSDPYTLCSGAGVLAGAFTTGVASVFGASKGITSVVPQPATASPYATNNLTCSYSALPAKFTTTAPTSYTGTVTCTASAVALLGGAPATYTITQGASGSSTVNQVKNKGTVATYGSVFTNNSFHITGTSVTVTATAPSAIAGLYCVISTDSLFVRTGT